MTEIKHIITESWKEELLRSIIAYQETKIDKK